MFPVEKKIQINSHLSAVSAVTSLLQIRKTISVTFYRVHLKYVCYNVIFFDVIIIYYDFFYSDLRPFQDYFSSNERGQSVGGAKTGEPRAKTPGIPASRTWLVSHMPSVGLEPTPDTAMR